jgi:PBP1b-binding outer membrane lipoprotein LpoB
MRSLQRNKRAALICALVLTLSGCADYMNRRDSVTLGIGNGAEGNSAIHVINPQPPAAYNLTPGVGN